MDTALSKYNEVSSSPRMPRETRMRNMFIALILKFEVRRAQTKAKSRTYTPGIRDLDFTTTTARARAYYPIVSARRTSCVSLALSHLKSAFCAKFWTETEMCSCLMSACYSGSIAFSHIFYH